MHVYKINGRRINKIIDITTAAPTIIKLTTNTRPLRSQIGMPIAIHNRCVVTWYLQLAEYRDATSDQRPISLSHNTRL